VKVSYLRLLQSRHIPISAKIGKKIDLYDVLRLVFVTETDLQTETIERVLITETNSVLCEVRVEAEETVE